MANAAYWQSPAVLAHTGAVTQALMHMFMGVFFYECILSAPFEWSILSGKRQIRWVHAAYFGSKLSLLGYCAAALAVTWPQSEISCRTAFHAIETCMGLTVFCSSVLLAFRTVCVYHSHQQLVVKVIVTLGAAGLLAVWMQGVRDVTAAWTDAAGHAPYTTGMCIIAKLESDYWVKYVVTIVFDAAILLMTAVGVARMAGSSRVGLVLVQQGIVYFILTLLANLVITVITLLQLSDAMALSVALPQSVICVICSCRLFRNLADGSSMRSANNSMSGSGAVELDANGDVLPTSTASKRCISRFFRSAPSRRSSGMPSFVSASSSSAKSPGEPATPGGTAVARLGYFDVAAQQKQQQQHTISSASHDPVDFISMMQDTRQRQLNGQATPSVSFGALTPSPARTAQSLPPPALHINIKEEKQTDCM